MKSYSLFDIKGYFTIYHIS